MGWVGGTSLRRFRTVARRLFRHPALLALWLVWLDGTGHAEPSAQPTPVRRGREFLVNLLDTDLGLLPEFRGAHVYWLWHDNFLAAKVLAESHPAVARTLLHAIEREGVRQSDGRAELLFGESKGVLPFRHYELLEVRQSAGKLIRTERTTDRPLTGWENYADLLLWATLAERNPITARRHWDAAMRLWDGKGFQDAAAKEHQRYATYKLALALLAARRLTPPAAPPAAITQQLRALQDESGGWITDYDAAGRGIGRANVETSCLAILALEVQGKPAVAK